MLATLLSVNARGRLRVLALLPAIIAATGCSKGVSESKQVPVFPVSGKVTFEGEVPVGALVMLHPVDSSNALNLAPSGKVNADGSFAITAYQPGDGAPAGDYVATIQWYKFDKEAGGAGPNVLPKKYSSPKDSPIKISVKEGSPTEVPAIKIAADNGKDKKKKG